MISFIIPVYNTVEEYIDRCINSICNAGFGDFELIVVNDGSSEEISDYLRKLVVRFQRLLLYNNIRLIEKQNTGVSDSRNVGLKAARGEWIWFVDSDDYIIKGASEYIEKAIITDCDTVAFSYIQEISIDESHIVYADSEIGDTLVTGKQLINTKTCSPTVWSFLFRKDIIEQYGILMSQKLKFGEDKIFILEYLYYAQKVLIIKQPLYRYVYCETSAVRKNYLKNEREINDQLESILELLRYFTGKKIEITIYDSQIFYLVTQFILSVNLSGFDQTKYKKVYIEFMGKLTEYRYNNILLAFVSPFIMYFFSKPYLLKRRFIMKYFEYKRKCLNLTI